MRDTLIQCLSEDYQNEREFLRSFQQVLDKEGDMAYPVLLNILTHLDFSVQEAKDHWVHILYHQKKMGDMLNRPVSLATAVCDFFSYISKDLKTPKVVEMSTFEETEKSAKLDGLTGLFNRGHFNETLTGELNRSQRYEDTFSLIFFDLDNFKTLNDTVGHQAGDLALKKVAQILVDAKRVEDTAARYGGEELILILPQTPKIKALVIAERIRKRVEEMDLQFQGESFRLTISGGVASYPMDATEQELLLRCADRAVYEAKAQGKNKIVLHTPTKRQYVRIDLAGEVRFKETVSNDSLTGKSKNVSVSGLLFESQRPLRLGTEIVMEIPIDPDHPSLQLRGRVLRVESTGLSFDIGVAFLGSECDPENSELATALMQHLNIPMGELFNGPCR